MRVIATHLASVRSRIVGLFLLTWCPLLAFTAVDGVAMGAGVGMPLLFDYAVAVRFLVAVPLLVWADALIRTRAVDMFRYLVDSGIVSAENAPAFSDLTRRFCRLRDSNLSRAAVAIVVVFTATFFRIEFAGDASTWQFVAGATVPTRTAAGWWYILVSVPTFHFLIALYLWRYVAWCWFLHRVSRFDLVLVPTHPDGSAGLTIVGGVHQYYGIVVSALSAIVSAFVAFEVLGRGRALSSFRVQLAAFLVMALIGLLLPLLTFTPALIKVRRQGLIDYGTLAADYTRAFHRKWIDHRAPPDEPLIGSADIQSLADLAGSFEIIHDMRIVPFELRTVGAIVAWAAMPLLPLIFVVFSPVEVVKGLVRILL